MTTRATPVACRALVASLVLGGLAGLLRLASPAPLLASPAGTPVISRTSRLYAQLAPPFAAFHPNLEHLERLAERRVDGGHTVVLVRALVRGYEAVSDFSNPDTFKQEAFGVFVLDRRAGGRPLVLDIFATKRWLDYGVRIVEATPERVTIEREGATYGDQHDKVTYFVDLARRALVRAITHQDVLISTLVQAGDGALYAIGSDGTATVVLRVRSPEREPAAGVLDVIDRIGGEPIPLTDVAALDAGRLVLANEQHRFVLQQDDRWRVTPQPDPASFRYNTASGDAVGVAGIRFWVPLSRVRQHVVTIAGETPRRFLVWSSDVKLNSHFGDQSSGIYALGAPSPTFHRFPQPGMDTFRRSRRGPAWQPPDTPRELVTEIGPFQVEDRKLWVATTFYDGEGESGVGGFGYFDADANRWVMEYPRSVADWSCSAMLVEPGAVWLGLVRSTEGKGASGGLARYDRLTHRVSHVRVPDGIQALHRAGASLYIATSDGLYVLRDGRLVHVALVLQPSGRYAVRLRPR